MATNTNGNGSGSVFDALFRKEGLVCDVDLRIDVAKNMSRTIFGDEEVHLDQRELRSRGDYVLQRKSRQRRVSGRYERTVSQTETVLAGSSVTERVDGGVKLLATVESEATIGGAYVNTIAGVSVRVCAWTDFLAWGGWLEADLVRVEIAAASIRAHMIYAHAAAVRVTVAKKLVDDWVLRTETFGTLVDNTSMKMQLGGPGSGQTMEN